MIALPTVDLPLPQARWRPIMAPAVELTLNVYGLPDQTRGDHQHTAEAVAADIKGGVVADHPPSGAFSIAGPHGAG
jgi:hypothetical protein